MPAIRLRREVIDFNLSIVLSLQTKDNFGIQNLEFKIQNYHFTFCTK